MLRVATLAVSATLIALPAVAASVAGTWSGSYVCNDIVRELTLAIAGEGEGKVEATFTFRGNGASGEYVLEGTLDAGGVLSLTPVRWVDNPYGYEMVGLSGDLVGDSIEGRITNEVCGGFAVQRTAAAPPSTPSAPAASPLVGIPPGSPLAPFEALAAANPASVPGSYSYPYIGNWAVDIPGGPGIWHREREIDLIPGIITDTHTLTIGVGSSNAGVLQISPDGRYRIAWLSGKWQGTWTQNTDPAFPGSILLQHPTDPGDNWIVFRNANGEMEARDYPYGGLSADRLHPMETAALAENLLATLDPTSLVGEWVLYGDNSLAFTEGTLSVTPDGRYRLVDELMGRRAEGGWHARGEYLVLEGGRWGEGDAALKFGDPGRALVVGSSEWVAVRR